jgi:ABC-type bacteriocin/lantibiotic exporter with double-glycine peptidase domain
MSHSLLNPQKTMRYSSENLEDSAVLTIVNDEKKKVVPSSFPIIDPHISVRNLNVHIQKNHILKNVNLDLPNKAITCIIGPSGCGKTTLLKTFNRLLERSNEVKISGEVLVDGENIHDS